MNLIKLFETQEVLDEKIMKEKGLEGQDLLPMKILALQVELGELANEWRGFKFWSENRKPRTRVDSSTGGEDFLYYQCIKCNEQHRKELSETYNGRIYADCPECEREMHKMKRSNPLLEEYVDCLHFILSIGLEIGVYRFEYDSLNPIYKESDITTQFLRAIDYTIGLRDDDYCLELLQTFIYLGEMLGFTWDEIETAYYAKNAINHERQATGY